MEKEHWVGKEHNMQPQQGQKHKQEKEQDRNTNKNKKRKRKSVLVYIYNLFGLQGLLLIKHFNSNEFAHNCCIF